jgi:predicted Zn-dependent protease
MSDPEGRGAAWTEERGTSDEGRRRLPAPRRGAGGAATSPQDTVERALAAARGDAIVIAAEDSSANLRWAGNTLTTNGVTRSRQLTVIALSRRADGTGVGAVSRTAVRDDQVAALVAEAEHAAEQSPAATDAQPLLAPGDPAAASPAGWDEPPAGTEIGVLGRFAADLGQAFAAARSGRRKLYGFAEHTVTSSFLGTSAGLRLRHDQPAGTVELNAKTADLGESAWAGAATRDFTDVDVAALEAGLAQRLAWAARRIELPAGRYETLLPPTAVADLLTYLYWYAGARDALDGRTVFSAPGGGTRIGEQLARLPLTLRSNPAEPGLECAPFVLAAASSRRSSIFDNGLGLRPTDWIAAGRLAALTQTRHSAQLAGMPVTPPVGNLILDVPGAGGSLPELVARTGRCLLLTSLFYIREVDPQDLLLTGLTRDGVYLVEDGEVVGAVNNFRFNESPVALLGRLAEAGTTVPTLGREFGESFSRTAMPPLRVEGFNMSSVSQAT